MWTNDKAIDVKELVASVTGLAIALLGFASVFNTGYLSDVPREAFLVFGKQISVSIGLQTGFQAIFSIVTAKVLLILLAVGVSIVGTFLSLIPGRIGKKIGVLADNFALYFALAPLRRVFVIALIIYLVRFFQFSIDAIMLVGGVAVFGKILFELIDRIFLQKIIVATNEKKKKQLLVNYKSQKLILVASLISIFAYSSGIAMGRHVMWQEPKFISDKIDQPGIIFGANDLALLVFVPGKLKSKELLRYIEYRGPSRWIILPFSGQPIELP